MKQAFFAVLLLLAPLPCRAQESRLLPQGRDLIPVALGDQREPRVTAKLLFVTEGATLFGNIVEGEAGVGKVFPLYLISGDLAGDYVLLGMGAGIWGRFNMETARKHLLSSDWNFRIPVTIRRGPTRIALSYNHVSSHLGDDYIDRFDTFTNNYSIDNLRALVFRTVGERFEFYAGGTFAVNINPVDYDRFAVEFGAQGSGFPVSDGVEGFAALHVWSDQNADWDPRFSLRTGFDFLPDHDNSFSIVMEAFTGPSPQGQLLKTHETFISLGVNVAY